LFKFINNTHATVVSTIKDLKDSGWHKIKTLKLGAVLAWEPQDFHEGNVHAHIGFYIGDDQAISNNWKKKTPQIHHYTSNGKRQVAAIYWNKKLN
jgi:hypothetical protein